MSTESPAPQWAIRLRYLCNKLTPGEQPSSNDANIQEIWQIAHLRLHRYLKYHCARIGGCDPDDLQDIASQKSLELLRNLNTTGGRITDLDAHNLPGYLSTVARNGLVASLREKRRGPVSVEDGGETAEKRMLDVSNPHDRPDMRLASKDFAVALRICAEQLEERARSMWFMRVFYDMPSKTIAAHPRIELKASHVDVVLQRSRATMQKCMHKKGYHREDMPPGTFIAVWQMFHPVGEQTEEML